VRTVHLDLDPATVGSRMPTEAPVVGDVAEGLRALLPMLTRKEDRSFLGTAQDAMAGWRKDMAALDDRRPGGGRLRRQPGRAADAGQAPPSRARTI
jgi:pyruvate dehydrogenase (quinone)